MNDQNTRSVFVTQEVRAGRIDYTPAREFGALKFITMMDFSSENDSIMNEVLINEIRTKLIEFNFNDDYIVITGSPLVSAAVFMVLRERTHRVNVLRWSNQSHTYTPVNINLM